MLRNDLDQLVGECAERHGAQVVEVITRGRPPRTVLEVFVDSEAGVTTDLCAEISRAIGEALRARPLLDPLIQLTVSSPGIERPLRFPWQYRKHVGRTLALHLAGEGAPGDLTARLTGVDADGITVEGERGEAPRRVPFDAIVRAVVRAPW